MTETIIQNMEEEPLQPLQAMKDLTAQWADYFNGIQRVLSETGTMVPVSHLLTAQTFS
jgi:hypothetical protein